MLPARSVANCSQSTPIQAQPVPSLSQERKKQTDEHRLQNFEDHLAVQPKPLPYSCMSVFNCQTSMSVRLTSKGSSGKPAPASLGDHVRLKPSNSTCCRCCLFSTHSRHGGREGGLQHLPGQRYKCMRGAQLAEALKPFLVQAHARSCASQSQQPIHTTSNDSSRHTLRRVGQLLPRPGGNSSCGLFSDVAPLSVRPHTSK